MNHYMKLNIKVILFYLDKIVISSCLRKTFVDCVSYHLITVAEYFTFNLVTESVKVNVTVRHQFFDL